MRKTIYLASGSIDILTGHELLRFSNESAACAFLRGLEGNVGFMQEIRNVVCERGRDISRMTNEEAFQQFASLLVGGRVSILHAPLLTARSGLPAAEVESSEEVEKSGAAARAVPLKTKRHWVEFKVVDDQTGDPVEGAVLNVKLPDGTTETLTTDAGGYIEINDCMRGQCELSCDFTSHRPANSYTFLRIE